MTILNGTGTNVVAYVGYYDGTWAAVVLPPGECRGVDGFSNEVLWAVDGVGRTYAVSLGPDGTALHSRYSVMSASLAVYAGMALAANFALVYIIRRWSALAFRAPGGD